MKNGCTNKLKQSASDINTDLLRYYTIMQEVFKEYEVRDIMPTPQEIKEAFNNKVNPTEEPQEIQKGFWEIFSEFVAECGKQNNRTDSTYEKFAAVKNHIKEFRAEPTFAYFNEEGLNNYVEFLRKTKDMRNSTIGKQLGFLKWFIRWAFKKGYHQNIAYETFKPKLKNTP